LEEIARSNRFRIRGHRLTVEGTCNDCSKARSRERRKQDRV
jgi:Fe2+ or Zn2+ uptake regulation protein